MDVRIHINVLLGRVACLAAASSCHCSFSPSSLIGTLEKGAVMSILSGFFFLVAAGLTFKSSPRDASIQKASCCCCPSPIVPYGTAAYKAVPAPEEEKVLSVAEAKESSEEKALVAEQAQPAHESE